MIYVNSLPEDNAGFELLSERMKDRVQKGLSMLKAAAPSPAPAPRAAPPVTAKNFQSPPMAHDLDDEIPF